MQFDTTRQNTKSGKGVAKQIDPLIPDEKVAKQNSRPGAQGSSKFTPQFWASRIFRPKFTRDGERQQVAEWYCRVQYDGRREAVGLNSNDRQEAARRAAKLYHSIRAKGWTDALAEFRPSEAPKCILTVGDWIAAVRPHMSVRDGTFNGYAYAFRKIAAGCTGLSDSSKAKFNPRKLVYRDKINAIPMQKVTPDAVKKWRQAFIGEGGNNPVRQQQARSSSNSYIRNARSLFGKEIIAQIKGTDLPSTLPFDGVKLEKKGNTRYLSTVDAAAMLKDAREELATKEPEAWKVILLALGAGLRRGEIDGLCRTQCDFGNGVIRVINHEHFEAKTEDSIGEVYVDPEMMAQLKGALSGTGLFIVEPDTPARPHRRDQFYRCEETFVKVTAWLRSKGVLTHKPLHTLRKEFGSIINAQSDIHTASRQLRHSNIGTTAAYYTDSRRRSTVNIGAMLKDEAETAKG